MAVLIAAYIVAGLAWGFAYWFGLRNGRAGVSRRVAWVRALSMLLLLMVVSGFQGSSSVLASSFVLPCCYLLGWHRTRRTEIAARAKII